MKRKITYYFVISMLLFSIFGMCLNIFQKIQEYNVARFGKIVEVVIKKIPKNCHQFSKTRKDFEFIYQNKTYSKWLNKRVCNSKIGDKYELIHWEKNPAIFIYPKEDEDIEIDIIIFSALALLGVLGLLITLWIQSSFQSKT